MTTKCKIEAVHIQTSTANQMEHLKREDKNIGKIRNNLQEIYLKFWKAPLLSAKAFQNLSNSLKRSLMKCLGFSASLIRKSLSSLYLSKALNERWKLLWFRLFASFSYFSSSLISNGDDDAFFDKRPERNFAKHFKTCAICKVFLLRIFKKKWK